MEKFTEHVQRFFRSHPHLFVVDVDKDVLWNLYQNSFPAGTNEIFKKRRVRDCSSCKQFVRGAGNVVAIVDNKIIPIWDFQSGDVALDPVLKALTTFIKAFPITDVFLAPQAKYSSAVSRSILPDKSVATWEHLYADLPAKFVNKADLGTVLSERRSAKEVLKRSLDEFMPEHVQTILDLINQNSLYRGEEWKSPLKKFLGILTKYKALTSGQDAFAWMTSIEVGPAISKIRNHSVGTLIQDIANDVDLDQALRKYEAIVAPTNYKRPKAVFTKKMIAEAEKTITELGLSDSLARRHATLDDISVGNILFSNKDAAKRIKGGVLDALSADVAENPKAYDKCEEIPVDHFLSHVLPDVKSMELLFENRLVGNLMSLIAPADKTAPTPFKWNNAFSWAYNGNIADSMKERVKAAGGNVGGVLRFSIQWNENQDNEDDLDAHCIEPNRNEIMFPNKGHRHHSTGMLDVDIIRPSGNVAVENINYLDVAKMPKGEYLFFVHNYTFRGAKSGFSAEIEFDGQIHAFECPRPLRPSEKVNVAKVTLSKDGRFSIIPLISSSTAVRKEWNVSTGQFHPVSIYMFSPNYWDRQQGIGHRHHLFMLKDCRTDIAVNGFFNEFLKEELMIHKRVFEALGTKMRVEPAEDQLSGLGFSSTKRDHAIVRISTGKLIRPIKIVF